MKKKQLQNKYSASEKACAIIGYLVNNFGYTIPASRYNKFAKEYGLESLKAVELNKLITRINEMSTQPTPPNSYKVFKGVLDNKLSLYDVFGGTQKEEDFEEDANDLFSTSVVNQQEIKDKQREFNKSKRTISRYQYALNQMLKQLNKDLQESIQPMKIKTPKVNKNAKGTLIMNEADWHIGNEFTVQYPNYTNTYNYKVFQDRLNTYIERSLEQAKQFNVKEIFIANIGDVVENVYMRTNQGFDSEFDYATQVSLATKAVIKSLMTVSEHYHVKFGLIGGNHDRVNGDKNSNTEDDSIATIIINELITLKELGILPNVEIIDNRKNVYSLQEKVEGVEYLWVHGDRFKINRKNGNNIPHLNGNNGNVEALVYGHYHEFAVHSGDSGRFEMCLPAMKGNDRYAQDIGTTMSASGQVNLVQYPKQAPIIAPIMFEVPEQSK